LQKAVEQERNGIKTYLHTRYLSGEFDVVFIEKKGIDMSLVPYIEDVPGEIDQTEFTNEHVDNYG
jgi:hypothetical protein